MYVLNDSKLLVTGVVGLVSCCCSLFAGGERKIVPALSRPMPKIELIWF